MKNTKALVIVDAQNDFCEGGALGVDGGHEAVRKINYMINREPYALIVATRDWHEADNSNGGHFAPEGEAPDFNVTWPHHCVQGTYGAQYADELDVDAVDEHITKGEGEPAYSGFQGYRMGSRVTLDQVLKDAGITELDVVGIATDFCVEATVLDGLENGYVVDVIADATAAVADFDGALKRMEAAGATIRNTELY